MELSLDSVVLVSQIEPRWYKDDVDVVSLISSLHQGILASASDSVSGLEKEIIGPNTDTAEAEENRGDPCVA